MERPAFSDPSPDSNYSCSPSKSDSPTQSPVEKGRLLGNFGSGSGGYAENVFRYAVKELHGVDLSGKDLEYKYDKSNDANRTCYN